MSSYVEVSTGVGEDKDLPSTSFVEMQPRSNGPGKQTGTSSNPQSPDREGHRDKPQQQSIKSGHNHGQENSHRASHHLPERRLVPDSDSHKDYKEPEHGTESEVREFDFSIKSPISTGHVIQLRGREVLFIIGVLFFLSVSIGLIVVIASNTSSEDNSRTCHTNECLAKSAQILAMMDTQAEPCSNFWRYACGGWLDQAKIPPLENSWGVSKELKYKNKDRIIKLLKGDIQRNSSESSERKMKMVFRSCMDVDTIDDGGTTNMLNLVNNAGGWALFDDWNSQSVKWDFLAFLKELHHKYYIQVFFTMFVHPDHRGSGNVLQFDQPSMPYGEYYQPYVGSPEMDPVYEKYMRTVAKGFNPPSPNVAAFINKTMAFERQLFNIFEHDYGPSMANPQDNYDNLAVHELQDVCPQIRWLDYIQEAFPEITSDSIVLVSNIGYFKRLGDLLRNTSNKVLNFYMMWRLVDDFAPNLPKKFRKAHNKLLLVHTGKSKTVSRQKYCLDLVGRMFSFALGADFVHKYFSSIEKQHVQEMIGYIRDTLHDTLNASNWLYNATKTEAMNKVNAMTFHVGYPDFIEDDDKVDAYYEGFQVDADDDFFDHLISYCRHELHLSRKSLRGTLKAPEWVMETYAVNAFINPFENTIVLPAGVLQSPHYDDDLPKYINYGTFGSVIGHEMMHSFDGRGAMFDAQGMSRMWWDPASMEEYNRRLECVSRYYSTLTYRRHKINGTTSQNENLADIEGLKIAYDAYHVMIDGGKEDVMPGLHFLTQKQIFFLSFAQNYCKIRKSEDIEFYLENSEHMIEEVRVMGTLAQVPAFAESFQCDRRSRMNPVSRCQLW